MKDKEREQKMILKVPSVLLMLVCLPAIADEKERREPLYVQVAKLPEQKSANQSVVTPSTNYAVVILQAQSLYYCGQDYNGTSCTGGGAVIQNASTSSNAPPIQRFTNCQCPDRGPYIDFYADTIAKLLDQGFVLQPGADFYTAVLIKPPTNSTQEKVK